MRTLAQLDCSGDHAWRFAASGAGPANRNGSVPRRPNLQRQPQRSLPQRRQRPRRIRSPRQRVKRASRRRKSRKPAKVFTNENLPTAGGISSVGDARRIFDPAKALAPPSLPRSSGNDEKFWRDKFAALRAQARTGQGRCSI